MTYTQCYCRMCRVWFRQDLMILKEGQYVCPICKSAEGIDKIEKNEMKRGMR